MAGFTGPRLLASLALLRRVSSEQFTHERPRQSIAIDAETLPTATQFSLFPHGGMPESRPPSTNFSHSHASRSLARAPTPIGSDYLDPAGKVKKFWRIGAKGNRAALALAAVRWPPFARSVRTPHRGRRRPPLPRKRLSRIVRWSDFQPRRR